MTVLGPPPPSTSKRRAPEGGLDAGRRDGPARPRSPARRGRRPAALGRYLDLAVEEARALHDLLRGHLQHLLADAILREHNGSVTLGPTRAPSPQPRARRRPAAPAPHLGLVPHRRHLSPSQRARARRGGFRAADSALLAPGAGREAAGQAARGPRAPSSSSAPRRGPPPPPPGERPDGSAESAGGGSEGETAAQVTCHRPNLLSDGPAAILVRGRGGAGTERWSPPTALLVRGRRPRPAGCARSDTVYYSQTPYRGARGEGAGPGQARAGHAEGRPRAPPPPTPALRPPAAARHSLKGPGGRGGPRGPSSPGGAGRGPRAGQT